MPSSVSRSNVSTAGSGCGSASSSCGNGEGSTTDSSERVQLHHYSWSLLVDRTHGVVRAHQMLRVEQETSDERTSHKLSCSWDCNVFRCKFTNGFYTTQTNKRKQTKCLQALETTCFYATQICGLTNLLFPRAVAQLAVSLLSCPAATSPALCAQRVP